MINDFLDLKQKERKKKSKKVRKKGKQQKKGRLASPFGNGKQEKKHFLK